jgi:nitrate reductase NapE component
MSDGGTSSYDRARDRSAQYLPGDRTSCRVHPDHRSLAVLETNIPWIVFVVLFPLIFVAIGGGGLWATWRGFSPRSDGAVESISETAARGRGHTFMIGFGLLFVAVGVAVLVPMTLLPSIRLAISMAWTETPCAIVGSQLRSWSTDDGTSYRADVLYQYSAGGREWLSNTTHFFPYINSGHTGARELLNRYPSGSSTTCWVDPRDPSRSVLERQPRPKHLIGLLPLVFVLAGLAVAGHGWKQKRARRAKERLRAEGPLASDDPVLLKPQLSPLRKVIGALFFSLIWNGIVSIFVWQVWKSWQSGNPEWFPTVFLIPFVLVGLLSVAFVGHFLLALANPRPLLTLTPGQPRLDDRLSLEWRFAGRAGRLSHLRIFLEGREEATYQRGTDTITDREVFATFELVNTANEWEIPRGGAGLAIPGDTMHSFEADSNKIIWEIKVEGEIEGWPDVSQNFPINVRPIRTEDLS